MKCRHCEGSIILDHVVTFEGTHERLVCLSCGREPKEENPVCMELKKRFREKLEEAKILREKIGNPIALGRSIIEISKEEEEKMNGDRDKKFRTCSKCDAEYPETKEFFHGNGYRGLKYICKKCCKEEYQKKRGLKKKSPRKLKENPEIIPPDKVPPNQPFQEYFSLIKKIRKQIAQEIIVMLQERFV